MGPCWLFFTEGFLFGSLTGSFQGELSLYFQFWKSQGLSVREVVKPVIRVIDMVTQTVGDTMDIEHGPNTPQ